MKGSSFLYLFVISIQKHNMVVHNALATLRLFREFKAKLVLTHLVSGNPPFSDVGNAADVDSSG